MPVQLIRMVQKMHKNNFHSCTELALHTAATCYCQCQKRFAKLTGNPCRVPGVRIWKSEVGPESRPYKAWNKTGLYCTKRKAGLTPNSLRATLGALNMVMLMLIHSKEEQRQNVKAELTERENLSSFEYRYGGKVEKNR